MAHFNWVDYSILGLFIFSIGLGLARGFLREILSLFTWVIAFILSSVFATRLASLFNHSASSVDSASSTQSISLVSVGVSYVIIFVATLIIGRIITRFLAGAAEGNGFSFINRFLGGVFGFARGILIVLVIIFLVQLTPASEQSYWTDSSLVIAAQPTVKKMNDFVEPHLDELKARMDQSMAGMNNLYEQGVGKVAEVFANKS